MNLRKSAVAFSLACALVWGLEASAAVVITGTRIVYPAQEREVTVKLNNNGRSPSLVQAWVDAGDSTSTPTSATAPFVLSPPVFRIDPGKGQSMRLAFTGGELPQDRESVFYLNVLEIPPKAEGDVVNRLDMAFRSRIKVFYRPTGLNGRPSDAPATMTWQLRRSGEDYVVEAYNPTAFHVSQTELVIMSGTDRHPAQNGMIAPGERKQFRVEGMKNRGSAPLQVEFQAINDYGALIPVTSPLLPE
jgi:chaperone protein EcpD